MSEPGRGSGLISETEWRKPSIRWGMRTTHALLFVGLVVIGIGLLVALERQ